MLNFLFLQLNGHLFEFAFPLSMIRTCPKQWKSWLLSSTFAPTHLWNPHYFHKVWTCLFSGRTHVFPRPREQTPAVPLRLGEHLSLHWPNEIQCSLGHWSTSLILSQDYSWPAHPPTHTQTHTSAVRHRAGKWGQRWLVVIHLTSVTAAANKSLIHRLIHRLSPPNSQKTMPSQNTLCRRASMQTGASRPAYTPQINT